MTENSRASIVEGVTEEDVEQLQRTIAIDRRYANTYRTAIEEAPTATDAKQASDRLRECEARIASGSRILAACERDRTRGVSPREAAGPETIRRAFLAGVLDILGDEGITQDHEEMARVYAERTHATTPGIFVSEEVYQRLMARADTRGTEPSAARAMDAIIELIYSPDAPNHTDVRDCVRLDPELVAMYYERIVGIVSDYGMAGLEHDARSDAGESETAARATCPTCNGDGSQASPFDGYCPAAWAHKHLRATDAPGPAVVKAWAIADPANEHEDKTECMAQWIIEAWRGMTANQVEDVLVAAPRGTALSEEECEVLRHLSYSVAEPDVYLPAFSQRDYTILHAALSRLSAPSAEGTSQ